MTISNIILIVIIILLALYCSRLKLREKPQEEDVSQLNAPKLHISNNDIMQYIRDFANKFTPVMENKGIEFIVKCRPESMMGWIDTDKIDKVLLLIISDMAGNATTGGKITIDVDTDQNYSRVFIRIRDNGQEISSMGYHIAYQLVQLEIPSTRRRLPRNRHLHSISPRISNSTCPPSICPQAMRMLRIL